MPNPSTPDTSHLIQLLGGPAAVARLFDGIKVPSVIGWRSSGIPAARLQTLQALALTRPEVATALEQSGFEPLGPWAPPAEPRPCHAS